MDPSTNKGISGCKFWWVSVIKTEELQVHKINILAQTIYMCTKRKINEEFIKINQIYIPHPKNHSNVHLWQDHKAITPGYQLIL